MSEPAELPNVLILQPADQDCTGLHLAALAVFSLLFGALGLATLPFAAEPNLADYSGVRGGVPLDRSLIATWGVLSTTLYCVACLLSLVGGYACLRLHWSGRPIMVGFGALNLLLGLAGLYFHVKIIALTFEGRPLPTFAFRFTSVAEWGVWGYGTLLGAYALWVMLRPDVKKILGMDRSLVVQSQSRLNA